MVICTPCISLAIIPHKLEAPTKTKIKIVQGYFVKVSKTNQTIQKLKINKSTKKKHCVQNVFVLNTYLYLQ